MCSPVAVGVAGLIMSAIGPGASVYNSNQQAKKAEDNQKKSIARQEKLVREAAPSEADVITTNEDYVRKMSKIRRGIAQTIYSNRNNQTGVMSGKTTVLGA